MRCGALDLLFVAPERLTLEGFLPSVGARRVRMLAVDEAHCISEWGHDFRPAYREISRARRLVRGPVLALTATATPAVREDIVASLRMVDPARVVGSFDRPNLSWIVRKGRALGERTAAAYGLVRAARGPSVVYAPTRRSVEAVRDRLAGYGMVTEAYHAGLPAGERSRVQKAFMEGECRVVVATNAFGMGIDKANVRLVVHTHLPGTLESYYQEGGRAGRDGKAALCVAFHGPGDHRLAARFIDRSHPPAVVLGRLWKVLRRRCDTQGVLEATVEELSGLVGGGTTEEDALLVLAALERTGAVVALGEKGDEPGKGTDGPVEGSQPLRVGVRSAVDLGSAEELRRSARHKLKAVRRYAVARGCRRRALLAYFGEDAPPRCGGCDRCRSPGRTRPMGHS
jgi:ATP-dependent DNA helicase RecQ